MEKLYELRIFAGLENSIIENIIKNLEKETFLKGQIILNEGDSSNGKGYIIISGEVEISIGGKIIANISSGDIFGEIALLNEENRTATVISKSDVELFVISQNTILEIMNEDNSLNKKIIKRIQDNIENSI